MEAHLAEDMGDFAQGLVAGMDFAEGGSAAGHGNVDAFGGEGTLHLLIADGFLAGVEGLFEQVFEFIAGAAGGGAFFAGQVAEAAQEVGESAVAAEVVAEPGFGGFDGVGCV